MEEDEGAYIVSSSPFLILIFSRQSEFWDSMEVIGQSVKSFHVDPVTTRITEVSNYPIRKRSEEEVRGVEMVRLLRRSQMMVTAATKVCGRLY